MPYTNQSSKKNAKKSRLSSYKRIIREKDAKNITTATQHCSINSLACNVIGFKRKTYSEISNIRLYWKFEYEKGQEK